MRNLCKHLPLAVLLFALLLFLGGCDGENSQLTFLDLLNTVLLGITAAGGIVLIREA